MLTYIPVSFFISLKNGSG